MQRTGLTRRPRVCRSVSTTPGCAETALLLQRPRAVVSQAPGRHGSRCRPRLLPPSARSGPRSRLQQQDFPPGDFDGDEGLQLYGNDADGSDGPDGLELADDGMDYRMLSELQDNVEEPEFSGTLRLQWREARPL